VQPGVYGFHLLAVHLQYDTVPVVPLQRSFEPLVGCFGWLLVAAPAFCWLLLLLLLPMQQLHCYRCCLGLQVVVW
jgi:hypothetical protein